MNKLAVLGIATLASLSLATCGSSSSKSNSSAPSKSSQAARLSSPKSMELQRVFPYHPSAQEAEKSQALMTNYNQIKLAAFDSTKGGSSFQEIRTKLGKPTEATKKHNTYTWYARKGDQYGTVIVVAFNKKVAIEKEAINFGNSKGITESKIKPIKKKADFSVVRKQLGTPMIDTQIGNSSSFSNQVLAYFDPEVKKEFVLTFYNGQLSLKKVSTTNLKKLLKSADEDKRG
ncbi:DUF3862 domain-containing protein [Secundilactobacillus folii]|nr:DUF3862 domain-containing protein [Secundilactobacillus folii]